LPVDLITANGNTVAIQLRGVVSGETYYLKVSSQTQSTGAYDLAANLGTETVTFARGGEGTLTPAAPAVHHDFTLSRTGLVHMVLAADGGTGTAVWTITDSDGNVVSQQLVQAGQGRSLDLLLGSGTYRISIGLLDPSQTLHFKVALATISDPVGARPTDPTGTPEPPDPNAPPSPPPPDDIQWEPADDPDSVQWY
jgi:hypothetical protein